jgi:HEPN domain-containing protein
MTDTPLIRPGPRIDHPEELDRLVRQIVEKVDPVAIYLFGSRARGDAHEDSDYDLMVVVPDDFAGEPGKSTADLVAPDRRIPTTILKSHPSSFEWRRHQPGTLEYDTEVDGHLLYQNPDAARSAQNDSCSISGENPRLRVAREWLGRATWHVPAVECCLTEVPDRAAYHIQQSAENLTKAALVSHGIRPRKGHRIGLLASLLPENFLYRHRFIALDRFSDYIWAYQYPSSQEAELPPEPTTEDVKLWLLELEQLEADFERWLDTRADPQDSGAP